MMNSVSVQIQRANNDAISNQVLPQIQNAFKAGSRHVTQMGWNVPAERPEYIAEDYRNEKIRSKSRSEFSRNRPHDENTDQAYDIRNNLRSEPFCNRLQDVPTDQAYDNR